MYVRCDECRRATWLEPVSPGSSAEWDCAGCSKSYTLRGSTKLGSGAHEQFRNALDLANRHGLDLPSAWSVLADLMSLRGAHACRTDMGLERPGGPPRMTGAPRGSHASRQSAADASPDSESAKSPRVESKRLARRHGLPVALASRVVKGELTLPAALLLRPTLVKRPDEAPPDPPATASGMPPEHPLRRLRNAALVGAAVLLISAVWLVRPRAAVEDGAHPRHIVPANTEVRRDTSGHPVQILGTDPESVLVAFCNEADRSPRCRPLKLVLGSPPRAGTRWGIFEKPGDPDVLHAIEIRRQGGARRWVAGDGDARIRTVVAPEQAAGAVEQPVTVR